MPDGAFVVEPSPAAVGVCAPLAVVVEEAQPVARRDGDDESVPHVDALRLLLSEGGAEKLLISLREAQLVGNSLPEDVGDGVAQGALEREDVALGEAQAVGGALFVSVAPTVAHEVAEADGEPLLLALLQGEEAGEALAAAVPLGASLPLKPVALPLLLAVAHMVPESVR